MEKIKTTKENRNRRIYMLAIEEAPNLDMLDPPATEEEIKKFKKMSKQMREQEARYEAEGIKITWDIPDSYD